VKQFYDGTDHDGRTRFVVETKIAEVVTKQLSLAVFFDRVMSQHLTLEDSYAWQVTATFHRQLPKLV